MTRVRTLADLSNNNPTAPAVPAEVKKKSSKPAPSLKPNTRIPSHATILKITQKPGASTEQKAEESKEKIDKETQKEQIKQKKQERTMFKAMTAGAAAVGALLAYAIWNSGPDANRPRIPSSKPAATCLRRYS